MPCFIWWILLIAFAIFLGIHGFVLRKGEMLFGWVWPVFGGAVVYLFHWISHDYYQPTGWCNYFLYFEIAILVISYAFQRVLDLLELPMENKLI